jgi:cation diffusion facilitator CzcD-associated flavoprotein CzcO
MPYPEHWPVYTPAGKLGDFLEWYTSALELYAWCNSTITSVKQESDHSWTIEVNRDGKKKRVIKPKHLILATSLAGVPYVPDIPGKDQFKGTVRHSTEHDSSRHWVGKKVLVVGTSSSGFDTAYDFARRNIDVTILQRSPTYIMSLTHSVPKFLGSYQPKDGQRPDLETTDRLAFSMPVGPGEELGKRGAKELEEDDAEILAGLQARGFKTWRGQRGTGVQTLGYTKNGGFYFDAGACEQIINGKIKVAQGSIERFTEDTVVLTNGTEEKYDLVVLATGFSNTISSVKAIIGDELASKVKPIWGIDEEGELNSAWRDCGVPNLWIMVGTLQLARWHSKKVALRIKADLEGVHGEKYQV